MLEDLTEHPLRAGFPECHPVMRSFLGVPIATAGRVYGRIYLAEKANRRSFTEGEASVVRSLAQSLAPVLEERRLREELKAERQRYQDLYENAPVGLYKADSDGNIRAINQILLSWLGCGKEEVIGRSLEEFLAEASRQKYREATVQGAGGAGLKLKRKDGSWLEAATHRGVTRSGSHTITLGDTRMASFDSSGF